MTAFKTGERAQWCVEQFNGIQSVPNAGTETGRIIESLGRDINAVFIRQKPKVEEGCTTGEAGGKRQKPTNGKSPGRSDSTTWILPIPANPQFRAPGGRIEHLRGETPMVTSKSDTRRCCP